MAGLDKRSFWDLDGGITLASGAKYSRAAKHHVQLCPERGSHSELRRRGRLCSEGDLAGVGGSVPRYLAAHGAGFAELCVKCSDLERRDRRPHSGYISVLADPCGNRKARVN